MSSAITFDDIEQRRKDARLTARELCLMADVHPVTWSRAKPKRNASPKVLRRMNDALDRDAAAQAARLANIQPDPASAG